MSLVWKFSATNLVPVDQLRTDEALIAHIHVQKKMKLWVIELDEIIEQINELSLKASKLLKGNDESSGHVNQYRQVLKKIEYKKDKQSKVFKSLERYDEFNDYFKSIHDTEEMDELIELLNIYRSKAKLLAKGFVSLRLY